MTYGDDLLTLDKSGFHIQDTSLLEICEKHKTPFYLYNGNLILRRYNELYNFINWDKLKIFYAMKANFNLEILKTLRDNNAYLDTVSPVEVILARKLGFGKERILYTANNITDEEMHLVKKHDVLFNIGSISRLEKYGKSYPGSEVCLRFNPDVVAGEHKHIQTGGDLTKFGILLSDVPTVKDIITKYDLKIIGLHKHTGSGIADIDTFCKSMENVLNIAQKEVFPDLTFMDFGGGFKVPYELDETRIDYEAFGKRITGIFSRFCEKYGKKLDLYFEPGKYIVAEAGYMIVQVNTLKNNRGRLIAGTNSGFTHLMRPILYDAYHHIINLSNPHGDIKKYDICGNICESGDCFAVDREMPEIKEGDYLAICNAGAYCYAMSSIYNLRPLPKELLILDNKIKEATKGLSHEELADQILGAAM
jgi:diaminopimelate decarboxylase